MRLTANRKRLIFKDHIDIDTLEYPVCVLKRKDSLAVRYLMRSALKQGCSVITYGRSTDYYRFVSDISPNLLGTITYDELITDARFPYIKNTCDKALKDTEKCYMDFSLEGKLKYIKNRQEGQQYSDPNAFQCFYQIKMGDIEKQMVITESVLVNMIMQALYKESLHEVVLFLEMPIKPVTLTAFDTLRRVKDIGNMSIISLYPDEEYDRQRYVLRSDGEKITLRVANKEFLVEDE